MSQVIVLSHEEMRDLVETSVRRGVVLALRETGAQFKRTDLTEAECAPILGVKPATLRQWRSQKRGPRFKKSGRKVFYSRQDVDAWLAAQGRDTVDSTDLDAMADQLLEGRRGKAH